MGAISSTPSRPTTTPWASRPLAAIARLRTQWANSFSGRAEGFFVFVSSRPGSSSSQACVATGKSAGCCACAEGLACNRWSTQSCSKTPSTCNRIETRGAAKPKRSWAACQACSMVCTSACSACCLLSPKPAMGSSPASRTRLSARATRACPASWPGCAVALASSSRTNP